MKITIFGAAGQTGKLLVDQALQSGYEVTAFVRKSSLSIEHKNLKIIQGDVADPDAVERAVSGSDAVISVLNTKTNAKNKPLTRGTQNILDAMHKRGIRRLIMSSSAPVTSDPGDVFNLKYHFITGLVGFLVKFLLRSSFDDIAGSVKVIQASSVDWTIVRMPLPTNKPGTGNYRAGLVNKKTGLKISRSNAARFMLDELEQRQYIRRTVVVWDF